MKPGDVLAKRFRLEHIVGSGGQAIVFAALDLQRNQRLAVKVARTDLGSSARQEAIAVLRWEAHLLRRLRHPALPRLHSYYHDAQQTWLARDIVIGHSLAEYGANRALTPATVQAWALQICDLLRYLHSQSPAVICGDIKPANLIVRQDGQLLLIDLGAAHTRTRRPPRRPRPRHGTPGYAAPEQMAGRELDERSDVFSLAVLCYELLTGHDPTLAPLQFDLRRLDRAAPTLAPILRQALRTEQDQRTPTAAVLRAGLAPPLPARPLALGYGVSIATQRDMLDISVRHPRLLEHVLSSGALERWLVDHPTWHMGALVHTLRSTRQVADRGQPVLDTLLSALAPADGSPLLRVIPERLDLGTVPIWRRGIWSRRQPLTIMNPTPQPLRWDLECPLHPAAEVRLLAGGKRLRRMAGVLAPGAQVRLALVAAGKAGALAGELQLQCGNYRGGIPWTAFGSQGIPVGRQFINSLGELDLSREDVVPGLEDVLRAGALPRWLRKQGKRALATEIQDAMAAKPDTVGLRLLVGRLLHEYAPARFPLIRLHGHQPGDLRLVAGVAQEYRLGVENCGGQACQIRWRSRTNWVDVHSAPQSLAAGDYAEALIGLAPPADSVAGIYQVTLELSAGELPVLIQFLAEIRTERWWQRWLRRAMQ